jgi:hypothetical protein
MAMSTQVSCEKKKDDNLTAYEHYRHMLNVNEEKRCAEQKQLERTISDSITLKRLMQVECGQAGHMYSEPHRPMWDDHSRRTCGRCGLDDDDERELVTWYNGYQNCSQKFDAAGWQ